VSSLVISKVSLFTIAYEIALLDPCVKNMQEPTCVYAYNSLYLYRILHPNCQSRGIMYKVI